MKPPKGFQDAAVRKELAGRICNTIDSYDAAMADLYDDWRDADDIYNDKTTKSSLEFLDDVTPYNFPLIQTRVDALVDNLCSGITGVDPLFVFESGAVPEEVRGAVEKTVQYALRTAGFGRKIRDAAMSAVLKSRGMLRLRYVDIERDNIHDELDVQNLNLSEKQYSGLTIDSFRAEDCVVWPLYSEDLVKASLVGHKFPQRLGDIQARQASGEYFDDVEIPAGEETDQGVSSDNPGDDGKICYDLLIKTRPAGGKRDLRYRVTVHYASRELLAMEEYRLPKPWYFAPGVRYEPNRFWGTKSVAGKMVQVQTVMNDAVTMAVMGSASAAFPSVVTSGGMQEAQRIRMGIGNLVHVKQPVNMQVVGGNQFNGGSVGMLIELCERVADAIAKISEAGMAQDFSPNTTATAAAGAMQGQARGLSAVTDNFGDELVKMADFARYLLAIKWDDFSSYHQDAAVEVADGSGRKRSLTGEDFVANYTISLNGSAGANPATVVQKLQLMLQAAQGLKVPLNDAAVFEAIMNALELPVNTSQLLLHEPKKAEGGSNGQITPEQLQQLLGVLRGQMAAGAMGAGVGGPAGAGQPNGPVGIPVGGIPIAGGMPGAGGPVGT